MNDEQNRTASVFDEDDTPNEECGIFGVFAPGEDVARLTFFGLFALQHRGQESAGIAVSDGQTLRTHKDMGLVTQVFDEESLSRLKGHIAIGHTRYSTTGSSVLRNAQPLHCCLHTGTVAVAHNGNLINTEELRREMEARGISFETTNDSEIIARLIAEQETETLAGAVRGAMQRIRGAYSLAIMTENQIVGVRDPYGVRPLCLGRLGNDKWVLASETCALNTVGATFVREVMPGEIVVIDRDGVRSAPGVQMERPALCMLEMIYFARPDSVMYGQSLHAARRRMGQELAREHPVPNGADLVIAIPDSGTPAALGFAEESGVPFAEGLIKSRYIHRTFIQPDQRMRDLGVRMKFTPIRETLEGKRVVMVDDSIVRGTTTDKLVRVLLDAGAREVHVRISAPPVKFPCFYGVDLANQDQLVAARNTVEEIRRLIGATSLGFLSPQGLARAVHVPNDNFCLACFTGEYPIDIPPHVKVSKFALEMPVVKNGAGNKVPVPTHSRDVGYDE